MADLTIRVDDCPPGDLGAAQVTLAMFAEALDRSARFVASGDADLVYSPTPPDAGIWIPMVTGPPLAGPITRQTVAGLTLAEAPIASGEPIPGDIVRSAQALLGDSLRSPHSEPGVEGYVDVLRTLLRGRPPTHWGLTLALDATAARPSELLAAIEAAAMRGLALTAVFGVSGRKRSRLARAVIASGGEVALDVTGLRDGGLAAAVSDLSEEAGAAVRVARGHLDPASLAAVGIERLICGQPGLGFAMARPFPLAVGGALRVVPNLPATAEALEDVRRAGGHAALGLTNATWLLVDEAITRGARVGPLLPGVSEPAGRLDGTSVLHLTSVHRPRDVRIFHKEVAALRSAGADARVLALAEPQRRLARIAAGWRLVKSARRTGADIYHVHDPELLPAAVLLAWRTGRPVIYDAHEYLGETTKTKRWLPARLRAPMAVVAERAEQILAGRLSATVTANEDLAARFAASGSRAVSVNNSPLASSFAEPNPPTGRTVLYVGGLGPLRGLPLMKRAFPLVQVEGAQLMLVGPGDPGDLPNDVRHLGVVDHAEIAALLAEAAVAWIPLQRHGNYDRAVPTKLIEAMAAGRPVVVSDLPRMAAIVRSARCGIVVTPDDPEAHAAAIRQLLEHPDRAAQMGTAGRQAFLDHFAFEGQAAKLVGLYREVLR